MLRLSRVASAVAASAALAATIASVALLAPAAGARNANAATAKLYVAAEGCTGHAYKPSKLTLACADDNLYVTGLKYSSYGGRTAKATGTIHENDCTPDCAGGRFHTYRGSIVLSGVVMCSDGRSYYGQAKYRFKAKYGKGTEDIKPPRLRCSTLHS